MERLIAGTSYSKALRLAQSARADMRRAAALAPASGRLVPVVRLRGAVVRSGGPDFYPAAAAKSVLERWVLRLGLWWKDRLRLMLHTLGLNFRKLRWDSYLIRLLLHAHSLSNKPWSVSNPGDSRHPAALQFARVRAQGFAERTPDEAEHVQRLGNLIRDMRRQHSLSRLQTAQLLDCDIEFVIAIENGYGNPEMAQLTLQRLRQMLNR